MASKRGRSAPRTELDTVRLDVFHHLFAAACEEMGATLQRSSFSPNIRERRDFSCALFDAEGRMIGQASHLPVHLGSTPMSVKAAIDRVPMDPGDGVVLNDPYAGGTHLPDITFVTPVFLKARGDKGPRSKKRPDFFCANRAHHADVGGSEPGSMAPSTDVHGEGLRIPPVRLVRGGVVEKEMLDLMLANMRIPHERKADLLAQWSTNRVGERRILEMAAEHGAQALRSHATQLMDWTERLTCELLRELDDGEWSFEDELEEPVGPRNACIRLRIEKRGKRLVCDFRETDALPASHLNATRAVTVSAVFYCLRTLLPGFAPSNDGILRPVEILTRPGTLVDARYPSGVAAGNVETSQRIVDVLFGALAQMLPGRIPAASAGTMSNLTFGGGRGADAFVYYETIAGGAGGGPLGRGANAVQTHMTNTRNTPIEALEAAYPVRVLSLERRFGSGGVGRHEGGDGLRKVLLFLAPVDVSWTAERQLRGPWGLAGGGSGEPGGARLLEQGVRRWRKLSGKSSLRIEEGGRLELSTPGGGGYGRPG